MYLDQINQAPKKSGIYLWKDENEDVIYVGKAKNINARLKQYIKGSLNSYKTADMMKKAKSFDYIVTKNEREALLLERNFINKYKPEFNILLMDDKRYPYIGINLKKDSLDIKLVYRLNKKNKNTVYFGPFPTGYGAKRMADLLNRVAVFEKGLPKRNVSKEYWEKQFVATKKMISNQGSLIGDLRKKMFEAAENEKYEIAHDIKETLNAIKFSREKQAIDIEDKTKIDVIAFTEKSGYLSYTQAFYRQGNLLSINSDILDIKISPENTINQFIDQYYKNNLVPDLIISNYSLNIEISNMIPSRGEKKQMLEIALENACDNIDKKLIDFVRKEEITIGALKKLKKFLGLKKLSHILMVDNSNTANTNPVSAIISYRNGVKNKSEYKRFKLEKTDRDADVEYMRQAVDRYFKNENNPIPDLFIVDGGIAQVNEVKKIIPDVNVIGLVKNEKHATDSLIDLNLEKHKIVDVDLLAFLKNIQIEVDRFAKSLHRKINVRTTLEGRLLNVDGIGAKTEEKLLKRFGNYSSIHNASVKDLSEVVSEQIANKIKEEFDK